jgi:endothelin-converting enzyme
MSLKEASDLTPELDLSQLIQGLAPPKVDVKTIIVASPPYMKKLSEIISGAASDTLQNYFIWKAVQSLSTYIEADAVKPYKRFTNELQGKVRQT